MRNPLLIFPLLRYLRRNRCTVVHTHNTACQVLAAVASCLVPLHLVTTEHNTDNRRRRWKGFRVVDRWMYRRYRQIVCVSEAARTALDAYLADPVLTGRMSVIPNGIDIRRFASAGPAADLPGQDVHKILMVSAFRPQKDQQTLIRAMRQLPEDYRLYLAGGAETDADRRQLADCQRLVRIVRRGRFNGQRPPVVPNLSHLDRPDHSGVPPVKGAVFRYLVGKCLADEESAAPVGMRGA